MNGCKGSITTFGNFGAGVERMLEVDSYLLVIAFFAICCAINSASATVYHLQRVCLHVANSASDGELNHI
jgi:hypothetical protein